MPTARDLSEVQSEGLSSNCRAQGIPAPRKSSVFALRVVRMQKCSTVSDTGVRGYLHKLELIEKSLSRGLTHNIGEKTEIGSVSQKSFVTATMKNFRELLCCEEGFRTLRGGRAGACISSTKSAHEQVPEDRRASSQQSIRESYPYAPSSSVLSISNTACQPTKNLPCFALDTDTIVDSQMRWTAEQIVNYLARVKTLEDIQELLKQDQFRKIYEQMRLYLMNDKWRERFIYYIDKVVARKRLGFKQMSNMYHALGILTVWSDALTDLG